MGRELPEHTVQRGGTVVHARVVEARLIHWTKLPHAGDDMRGISGNHNAACQLRAKELYIMLFSLALDWWPYVDLCWN